MKVDTKDRMIASAASLLRARGYAGTGLNQITAESHAPKGSMYHWFPEGKEQLAADAIAYYGDVVLSLLNHCLQAADLIEGVKAFVAALAHQLERSQFHDGCPVGLVAMETGAASRRLAAATAAVFELWRAALAEALTLKGIPDADDRATALVAALEGGVILCRAQRSTETLWAIVRAVTPLLRNP